MLYNWKSFRHNVHCLAHLKGRVLKITNIL